ncbi:MAG: hypothetical protein J0L84_01790 [Verrucomicrobia bacterium]|nr:hypothetical protein [Verrucomicrobiota bacterium]
MNPRLGRPRPAAVRIAYLLLLPFLNGLSHAQELDRLCPPNGAETVFARPTVAWAYGTDNLLSNPGFEDGTAGWTFTPGGQVTVPSSGAAEGTHALQVIVGVVSREITLPQSDDGITLSYAVRGLVNLVGPDLVTVEPVDGSEPPRKLPIPGFTSPSSRWSIHTADLSAYRGQTVRLTWTFPNADSVPWLLDDVRITPVTPGTAFDVWWRRNRAGAFELLGRTAVPSWTFPELVPVNRYDWRVDVVRDGVTNAGPILGFTTANAFGAEMLTGEPLPPVHCPDQPLTIALRATDERGFPARNTPITFTLGVSGTEAHPPGVAITEVDIGASDGVEFQNLSHQAVDVSGWQVELFRMGDTTTGLRVTVPAGSVLASGARFTLAEGRPPTAPWPSLGLPSGMDWAERPGLSLAAGVVLRNRAAEVQDAVFIEPQPRVLLGETIPRQSRSVTLADWRTLPIASTVAPGESYQRRGARDQNAAGDWEAAPASFGLANPALTDPFLRGFGSLPVVPRGLTNVRTDREGWVRFPLTVSGTGSHLTLQARLRRTNPTAVQVWESNPFDLTPTVCLSLELPERVAESAGVLAGALRVRRPVPGDADLVLQLSATGGRLGLPESLVIPAGQLEASADLAVNGDLALTGPVSVTVRATAPGFSPVTRTVVVEDDETTTMRWELPGPVVEGGSVEAQLILGRVADGALNIPVISTDPQRLSAQPFAFVPAGADRASVTLTAGDNTQLNEPVSVAVTASFPGWADASTPVTVSDNETNTITLVVNFGETPVEGQTADLSIVLGGGSPTHLPMTIAVSRPARVLTPDYPEFPAIGTGINVPLVLVEDSLTTGREEVEVTVSLPGYVTGRTTFLIQDNDPGRLHLTQPSGPESLGGTVVAHVQAQTVDGDPLPQVDLSGAVPSLVGDGPMASTPLPTVPSEDRFLVSVQPQAASPAARLRVEALGLQVESLPIPVWAADPITGAKWAAYDAARDRIIVLPISGAMVAVDPSTGVRTEFPTRLDDGDFAVASDDGVTLHVVRADRRRIARFHLASGVIEAEWALGTDPEGRILQVDHLAAVPGQPQAVVVSRRVLVPEATPVPERVIDLVVYDGPSLRPQRIPPPPNPWYGSTVLVPAGAQEVFLVEHGWIHSFRLGSEGLTEGPASKGDLMGHDYGAASGTAIEVLGSVITRRGQWLDPRLPGELAYSSLGFEDGAFGWDRVRGVLAAIVPAHRTALRLLSPLTLREIATLPLAEPLVAPVVRLEPAGAHRWMLVHDQQVRLIPVATPPAPAATDLGVTATVSDLDANLSTAQVTFRITNHGPGPATDVTLSLGRASTAFHAQRPAFWLVDAGTNLVTGSHALGGRFVQLGSLEPGAHIEVPMVLPAFSLWTLGDLEVSAIAGSAAPDPDPANNRSEVRLTGLLAPPPVLRLLPSAPGDPATVRRAEFTTGYGHTYRFERSSSLQGPWEDVYQQDLVGDGRPRETGIVIESDDDDRYWRVRQTAP